MELYTVYQANNRKEATDLQLKIAAAEWAFAKGGINGSKWVVAKMLEYPMESAACRRPYPLFTDEAKQNEMIQLVQKLKPEEELIRSKYSR